MATVAARAGHVQQHAVASSRVGGRWPRSRPAASTAAPTNPNHPSRPSFVLLTHGPARPALAQIDRMARRHRPHSHLCAHSVIDTRRPNRPDWGLEAGTVPCTVLAAMDWLPAVCVVWAGTHPRSTTRRACQIKMRMIDLAREPGATLTRNSCAGGRGGGLGGGNAVLSKSARTGAQTDQASQAARGGLHTQQTHGRHTADTWAASLLSCRPSASCGPSKSLGILCHHEASLTNMAA